MDLMAYARKILSDHGCDEYTYGGVNAKHVLNDLKEKYKPGELEYPYVQVANAILLISRPKLIERKPYRMLWDTASCCDATYHDSYKEAKCAAEDTLYSWMEEAISQRKDPLHPTQKEKDDWDYMIYNCGTIIEKYDPVTDDYYEYSGLTYEEEREIGWKTFAE